MTIGEEVGLGWVVVVVGWRVHCFCGRRVSLARCNGELRYYPPRGLVLYSLRLKIKGLFTSRNNFFLLITSMFTYIYIYIYIKY